MSELRAGGVSRIYALLTLKSFFQYFNEGQIFWTPRCSVSKEERRGGKDRWQVYVLYGADGMSTTRPEHELTTRYLAYRVDDWFVVLVDLQGCCVPCCVPFTFGRWFYKST